MEPRFILSGGGTGGHIFPAVAIANALKELHPEAIILFVGAIGKMEMEKVPAAGYKIEGLWISGLQRKLFSAQNLLIPFKIISSYLKARSIIKNFNPHVVIGTGGYASWAIVKAAASLNIPTLIQEQNSFPGKTNLDLANKASRICVAYPEMDKFFPKEKLIFTGNPVRQDICNLIAKKKDALSFFNLDPSKKTVLVIGGSLGAKAINETINSFLGDFKSKNVQLIWQTGKGYFDLAKKSSNDLNYSSIKVVDFIQKMDYAYAASDIIISRAGAGSVSEICIAAKASILVPLQSAAEDHQTKNAMALVDKNGAILVREKDAMQTLNKTLFELLFNELKLKEIAANANSLAKLNAANTIAKEVMALTK